MDFERKIAIADWVIMLGISFVACLVGKICMERYGHTWISFNGPAFAILGGGLLIWLCVRRWLLKKKKDSDR